MTNHKGNKVGEHGSQKGNGGAFKQGVETVTGSAAEIGDVLITGGSADGEDGLEFVYGYGDEGHFE